MKTHSLMALVSSLTLLIAPLSWAQQEATEAQSEPVEEQGSPPAGRPTTVEPTQSPTADPAEPTEQRLDTAQSKDQESEDAKSSSQSTIPLASSKPAQQETMVSSNTIVGATVKNPQGEELGEIEELMIDPQTGTVKQAVLALSGGWLTETKRVALPWETLKVGLGKDELVVEMDKEQLQQAPSVSVIEE